mmetsp:Transcript_21384/g.58426  ORF Transcript_21384/g.58426 Transcript_21384/m.58426 type:complete len:262 (-) Transcript_21384:190-975(-)
MTASWMMQVMLKMSHKTLLNEFGDTTGIHCCAITSEVIDLRRLLPALLLPVATLPEPREVLRLATLQTVLGTAWYQRGNKVNSRSSTTCSATAGTLGAPKMDFFEQLDDFFEALLLFSRSVQALLFGEPGVACGTPGKIIVVLPPLGVLLLFGDTGITCPNGPSSFMASAFSAGSNVPFLVMMLFPDCALRCEALVVLLASVPLLQSLFLVVPTVSDSGSCSNMGGVILGGLGLRGGEGTAQGCSAPAAAMSDFGLLAARS